MPPVTVGDVVFYILPGTTEHGSRAARPAIVTYVWPDGSTVGLQVFTDGALDGPAFKAGIVGANPVTYDASEDPATNTWHFRS
jgi:hypothetical protein